MLCWKPSRKFFFEFAKVKFYFAEVGYYNYYICKGLLPTAAGGPAGEGHQRMRVAIAKFPKARVCERQTPGPPGLRFSFSVPPADGRGL